jgi:hypothetical protein
MDDACANDGIYNGRYVLVEYDQNPARGATRLIAKGASVFYYADFPTVQAIPGTTAALGSLYYVVDENTGEHRFYVATGETKIKDDGTEEFVGYFSLYVTSTADDTYNTNWHLDYNKYRRGFDSTVWQKVYDKGSQVYIMIAELNTVVPNFAVSPDAPTKLPMSPHIDENSTNLNINLHLPTQWGFRVAATNNGNLSDEKVEHENINYKDGIEQVTTKEVPANIFYNKDGLKPYEYIEI